MLTVEEVEMKRVRREEHFSKTRTFKKQKIRKKVKILKYYFFLLKKVILEKISGKFRILKKPENPVSLYSSKGRSHPCPEINSTDSSMAIPLLGQSQSSLK